jgi:hypothetical protein
VQLLTTIPGVAWVLAYTIAAEIGDITRLGSPTKLAGYTGLCPRVYQSALGADRGDQPRQPPPRLSRPLPTDEAPARQAARRQGCPSRPRPPTRRGDLAHAHQRPSLRPGRRHGPHDRMTVPKGDALPERAPIQPCLPTRRR